MEQTSAKTFTNRLFYAILLWQCNKNLKKVMVIGSGPIVIGQAAEFDCAGTQACLALKAENGFICYKRLLL